MNTIPDGLHTAFYEGNSKQHDKWQANVTAKLKWTESDK
jgi:hypothetical protein